jgi:hypothetical protein
VRTRRGAAALQRWHLLPGRFTTDDCSIGRTALMRSSHAAIIRAVPATTRLDVKVFPAVSFVCLVFAYTGHACIRQSWRARPGSRRRRR